MSAVSLCDGILGRCGAMAIMARPTRCGNMYKYLKEENKSLGCLRGNTKNHYVLSLKYYGLVYGIMYT